MPPEPAFQSAGCNHQGRGTSRRSVTGVRLPVQIGQGDCPLRQAARTIDVIGFSSYPQKALRVLQPRLTAFVRHDNGNLELKQCGGQIVRQGQILCRGKRNYVTVQAIIKAVRIAKIPVSSECNLDKSIGEAPTKANLRIT